MNFIACNRHPKQSILFLYLLPQETECLCENCVEDSFIKGELIKINKLITINTLLEKPEMIFQKLELSNELQNICVNMSNDNASSINEQIKEIEKSAQTIQQQIQEMLQKLKNCVQNIENLRKQFQQDLIKGQLLIGLSKSEDTTNPDAINQLKQKLHLFFQQIQKDNGQGVNNIILFQISKISNSVDLEIQKLQTLDQLKAEIEQFHNDQHKIANSIYPYKIKELYSTLLTKDYSAKIISLVKERQKCEIQFTKLIYFGSKDGLNAQSFWSKVNGKKNLLMIFKSKSNYIFGGYSPCQWQQNLINYVQDDTNSSFLFSYTHDEIYPKEVPQHAIYCNSTCGPILGGGHDINIAADFQGGYSILGYSYIINFTVFLTSQKFWFILSTFAKVFVYFQKLKEEIKIQKAKIQF